MNRETMFSSRSEEWETPDDLFSSLDREFGFNLDPCATEKNKKCERYFSKEIDGLSQDWGGQTVFCNPPYGRRLKEWVKKAVEESKKPGTKIVLLIPARTDTSYFHDYLYKKENVEIRFLRGRIKFGNCDKDAPFPSMIVILGGGRCDRET